MLSVCKSNKNILSCKSFWRKYPKINGMKLFASSRLLVRLPTNGLLSVMLVRYGQLLAALCTARSQDAAAILGGHALAETMLVHAATIVRLKCSFHCFILNLFTVIQLPIWSKIHISGCKITHLFRITQVYCEIFHFSLSTFHFFLYLCTRNYK